MLTFFLDFIFHRKIRKNIKKNFRFVRVYNILFLIPTWNVLLNITLFSSIFFGIFEWSYWFQVFFHFFWVILHTYNILHLEAYTYFTFAFVLVERIQKKMIKYQCNKQQPANNMQQKEHFAFKSTTSKALFSSVILISFLSLNGNLNAQVAKLPENNQLFRFYFIFSLLFHSFKKMR